MNNLIIIGNGFDLAHGLKTSYKDFLTWCFDSYVKSHISGNLDNNPLISAERKIPLRFEQIKSRSLSDSFRFFAENRLEINYKNSFFKQIVETHNTANWVDIEILYFQSIKEIVDDLDLRIRTSHLSALNKIHDLNKDLLCIKELLIEYIINQNPNDTVKKKRITHILRNIAHNDDNNDQQLLCLNFNYTKLIFNYAYELNLTVLNNKNSVINIHGDIENKDNPIIFGYGDETDPYYGLIENLTNNSFRDNIKSFWYLQTDNYRNLVRFCESNIFKVFILGHSCGLSDRVLLNYLFEHDNCQEIQIYYHQREDGTTDFFEKTQEISRHFRPENKAKMRNKIVPFDKCEPLVRPS